MSCRVENLLTSLERLLEYSQLPDEVEKSAEKVKFNRDRAKENLRRILAARSQSFTPFKSGNVALKDFSYAYANDVVDVRQSLSATQRSNSSSIASDPCVLLQSYQRAAWCYLTPRVLSCMHGKQHSPSILFS